jgi:hypothetical protein
MALLRDAQAITLRGYRTLLRHRRSQGSRTRRIETMNNERRTSPLDDRRTPADALPAFREPLTYNADSVALLTKFLPSAANTSLPSARPRGFRTWWGFQPPKIPLHLTCFASPSWSSPAADFQRLTQTPRKADPCDPNSPFSRRAFCAPRKPPNGLSARTLEKHRTYGTGPAYRKLGGRVVYAIDDLEAWADRGAVTSTSDPRGSVLPAKRQSPTPPARAGRYAR